MYRKYRGSTSGSDFTSFKAAGVWREVQMGKQWIEQDPKGEQVVEREPETGYLRYLPRGHTSTKREAEGRA